MCAKISLYMHKIYFYVHKMYIMIWICDILQLFITERVADNRRRDEIESVIISELDNSHRVRGVRTEKVTSF